jgi:hypothetical protein
MEQYMSRQEQARDYYYPREIRNLLEQAKKPSSTFYTLVREKKIQKYLHEQEGSEVYARADVDAYLAGRLTKSGERKRTRDSGTQTQAATKTGKIPIFRPLVLEDIGKVYQLQFDEFKRIGGMTYAVQPASMEVWIKEQRQIFWVAQDSESNRILASIGVIPLDEEIIIRFLRGEFSLFEVAITDVLSFQAGSNYACYMIAAADHDRPEAANALIQLMEHLLLHWCEHYPDIAVRILYVLSSLLDMNESPVMLLLRSFFFSRRRDLSPDPNKAVWELPLDEPNPSSAIQQFQKCVKEKRMLIAEFKIKKEIKRDQKQGGPPFKGPLEYRPAISREDVATMVEIGAEIFLSPGAKPTISSEEQTNAWYLWLQKNPEIFHVIVAHNEIIGYISLMPLPQSVIDDIMRGTHPVKAISVEDVLMFEPGEPLNTYVHIWGVTPRLNDEQKRYAALKMIRELSRMFLAFGERGVDIKAIYTRSNKKDGINISDHFSMERLNIPGVTDLPDEEGGKRVFRLDTTTSTKDLMIQYRQVLAEYKQQQSISNSQR